MWTFQWKISLLMRSTRILTRNVPWSKVCTSSWTSQSKSLIYAKGLLFLIWSTWAIYFGHSMLNETQRKEVDDRIRTLRESKRPLKQRSMDSMFRKTTISGEWNVNSSGVKIVDKKEQQTTTQSIPANLASYQVEYSHSPIPQVHQTQFINPGTGYNSPVSQTHQHGSSTPPIMIPNMMQMAPR